MPIVTGKKIWVESLLSDSEWKEYSRKYPKVCSGDKPQEFDCEFKWRKGMGANLTQEEINNIAHNIDFLIKRTKK